MRNVLLVICFLCATFSIAQADPQALKDGDRDYHDIIDDFFNLAQDQQMTQAVDGLFQDVLVAPNPDNGNKGNFDDVKAKLLALPGVYGNCCAHSRMFERMVAKRLVFVDYIVIFEKQPVEFSFQFYRPKDKWMLYGFSIDTDIAKKLDDKIRDKMLISDLQPKI